MRPMILLVLLTTGLLLGGCTAPPVATDTPGPTSSQVAKPSSDRQGFDGASKPAGWIAHRGNWTMKSNGTGYVLEGRGDAEPGLSSLVDHNTADVSSFTLEVDFMMVSGEHPQGAGVVFDWKDDQNYNIIRYSISEHGWHIFTVVKGNRNKQGDATLNVTVEPDFNQWYHLKVVQKDGKVTAFDGSKKVIEYTLKTDDSAAGLTGVFCRGDTVALFDNFRVGA